MTALICPPLSTTVTVARKPSLRHCAMAAVADSDARASEIFRVVTRSCAGADAGHAASEAIANCSIRERLSTETIMALFLQDEATKRLSGTLTVSFDRRDACHLYESERTDHRLMKTLSSRTSTFRLSGGPCAGPSMTPPRWGRSNTLK